MTSFWHVAPAYRDTPAAKTFASLDATFAASGEYITSSPISRVVRVEAGKTAFFVKTYTAGGKNLRRWFGRSRARAEWENLLFFERLGIPIAPVVAYGQATRFGMFRRGALVTAEVSDTYDLARMHDQNNPLLSNRKWLKSVSHQIADYASRLHRRRFGHLDLKWRNILVTQSASPKVYFIDCPGGKIRRGPLAERWFIKDLASLDDLARKRLSRTQRLHFFMIYRHLNRLTPKDKAHIRKVLDFYKGRR